MFEDHAKAGENGNVLFLILIAVALFAALSFAVTMTTRSGDEGTDTEVSKIGSASLVQFAAGMRGAILRMETRFNQIEFNPPEEFDNCTSGFKRCIFHPAGGAASYSMSAASVMAGGVPRPWIFNGANQVKNLGTSTGGDAALPETAELIAFLPGISEKFCRGLNKDLGITGIPEESGILYTSASAMVNPDRSTPTFMAGNGATIGSPTGTNVAVLDGHVYGCFSQGGTYVYYHVLIEQ